MIKLRLKRMGAKKRPSYRIVAADSRSPRDGRFVEAVGFYDPITEPATINLNDERVRYWLGVGAQPTDSVRMLLQRTGVLPRDWDGATEAGPVAEVDGAAEVSTPVAADDAAAEPVAAAKPATTRRRKAAATDEASGSAESGTTDAVDTTATADGAPA